jgi:hypothetical protein
MVRLKKGEKLKTCNCGGHFKQVANTYTQHYPNVQADNRQGKPATDEKDKPIFVPPQKNSYKNLFSLMQDMKQKTWGSDLIIALQDAIAMAQVKKAA